MSSARQIQEVPDTGEFKTFMVDNLEEGSTTDFDLFLRVAGVVTLYAPAPYSWKVGELKRLQRDGHATLFYISSDSLKVEAYQRLKTLPPVDRTSPPRKRIKNLTDVGAELTRVLHEYPLSASSYAKAEDIAGAMAETIMEDWTCVTALGNLANHDYYTYFHSARVAAYSLAIAFQQSMKDLSSLKDLATGCLLHDIGKSKVDISIINKPGKLTDREWGSMKKHPEFGDVMVSESVIAAVPRGIVLHHHERTDGKGYPHNLGKHELLDEVKIAAFADVFDALTTNRSYQASRTRFEALDLIRFKLLDGLDHEAFKAMVAILEEDAKS